jgi:glycerol uptake facilitator-like aquaporin
LTTGATLLVLIRWLAPLSGAHFNPLITLIFAVRGEIAIRDTVLYISSQLAGAVVGVGFADVMFDAPAYSLATHARPGFSASLGEFVSTFGLVGVVWICSRRRESSVAGTVAAYVFGAFWFTPTGFANPAVTIARTLTNTYPGIRLADVPAYVVAEIVGAVAAGIVFRWLLSEKSPMVAPRPRP